MKRRLTLLHYAGMALVGLGVYQLTQLDMLGFGTIVLGVGVWALGFEFVEVSMRTPEEREELYSKGKIRFPGLRGTWYRVDREVIQGVIFEAYESEIWGDEAAWVIATEDGQVIIPEAWNGLGDLHEWLDNGEVVIHHDGAVWVKPEEEI